MIRSLRPLFILFAVAAALPAAVADDADLSGNWLLRVATRGADVNLCILKVESKDGSITATVAAVPPNSLALKVKDFKVSDKMVTFALSNDGSFFGKIGEDPKTIPGSFRNDTAFRATLTRTDKDSIPALFTRADLPEAFVKAQQFANKVALLRAKAFREKDADKKKELLESLKESQEEADKESAILYRETVEKADSPYAIDAALALIQSAAKSKVTADEAKKLVATMAKVAAPYGPAYVRAVQIEAGEMLAKQKGLAGAAADVLGPMTETTPAAESLAAQVRLLSAYKSALDNAGRAAEAKKVDGRLVALDAKLDEDYLAKVPPFKPAPFAGRKDKKANRTAVMELFTGAQCPPCVAADVAFDSLVTSYKPAELVLLQYHMHIPGPDPMTNPTTVGRFGFYSKLFPSDMRGTPSVLFNGKPQAGGGGGMANAERKAEEYRDIIDSLLEAKTSLKLAGNATRTGDKVQIEVELNGAEPDESAEDLRLRLVLVEDIVKYVGGNKLRFHHHVVRAMPGGAEGVAVKEKSMKHSASVDVGSLRTDLSKYLVEFEESGRPFPSAARPLEMGHLKAIALVQNDKTGEILQALQMEVERK
jgi:hypothetical protein